MRLIDADEYKGKVICNHLYSGATRLIEVDSVPTAFDLESVIAKIEEKRDFCYREMKKQLSGSIFEAYHNRGKAFNECLEILKSAANATNGKNGG